MSSTKKHPSKPPQPPEVDRRLQFHLLQLIGMPLVLLVPILALLGVFGETVTSTADSSPRLEMRVEYPTRFRYKMIDEVTVSLLNVSSTSLPIVKVGFDRSYIDQFSTVTFTPSVREITEHAYIVELNDLQAGETRVISVTIQAEVYGNHRGTITAGADETDELQVSIGTITFP